MKFLPILDELFASDSIIFLLIGLACAILMGIKTKKHLVGALISLLVYIICEIISNFHTGYLTEILLLFVGTTALGGFVGFIVFLIVFKIKNLFTRSNYE